ncbi:sphingomyelin phosphodiesterase [Daldinia sp. FL1419]|nr:sphingomyelin phosphodiesterase [Daldinia sp. FL1419]
MRAVSFIAVVSVIVSRRATAYLDFGDESQKVLSSGTAGNIKDGFDPSSIITSTREDAQSPASCAACEAVLVQLKLIAAAGDAFFIRSMTEICQRSGVQDADVCAGSIALEGPIVAHSLRGLSVGSRTSRLVCVALMRLCQHPEVVPYNVSFPSPKRLTGRPPPSGLEPIQVVHFSDIHVDPLYVEGANANCTKPICCRTYTDADKPGFNDFPAGPYGEHTCDSPVSLEESMYAAIQEIAPNASFAIFTGDVVDHAVWNTSESQNAFDIEDAYGRMARAGLRVYGTAGNHEASPTNSFPPAPADSDNTNNTAQWLYDLLSATWSRWIGPRAAATTREFGAYSVQHNSGEGKLRIISLSTNLYYVHNYWLYEEPMQRDPSGQLAWLVEELDAAEKGGERVYIIGHMSMGSEDAFHDASNYFDQVVKRYEGTIAAMFFGHTHYDEFQLSYSDNSYKSHSTAIATSYIAPSLTPTSGNPAFRVYTVDPITFGILDVTTYIANTSDPSFSSPAGPRWSKYYSASSSYGPLLQIGDRTGRNANRADLPTNSDSSRKAASSAEAHTPGKPQELTPAAWHNITSAFENHKTLFEEYVTRKTRGGSGPARNDGKRDREAEICKIRAARAQDRAVCAGRSTLEICPAEESRSSSGEEGCYTKPSPETYTTQEARRPTEKQNRLPMRKTRETECEGSVIHDILENLVRDIDMLELLKEFVAMRALF